jgi:ABC-type transport system involved in multi-copper enzyme maturation permease subunit
MPVYDYSYKIWEGHRRGPLFRWLAIPKFAYLELLKLRIVTGILTIAAVHFLARLSILYLYVNEQFLKLLRLPPNILPPIDAWFFKDAVDWQFPLCFILAFVIGANLISRDLKHNAVVLYASKPISRWEYLAGKFSVLFFIFMGILGGLPLLLFLLQTAVAPAHSTWHLYFWSRYAKIGPAIVLYGLVASTTLSLLIMTASSLVKNGRYAGIAFAGFIIGSNAIAGILSSNLHSRAYFAISPFLCGVTLGDYIFGFDKGGRNPLGLPESLAWGGILAYWVLCLAVIHWRVSRAARSGR